jgi:hypothetical protein
MAGQPSRRVIRPTTPPVSPRRNRRGAPPSSLRRQKPRLEALEERFLPTGTITGLVFEDFNANGTFDQTGAINNNGLGTIGVAVDRGIGGVTATAYDKSNNVRGVAVSGSGGTFALSATGTGPYRVEFTNLPAGFFSGPHGVNSGTTVQFVPDGNSTVQLGLSQPLDYSQNNPDLVTSRYVFGDQINGPYKDLPVVVSFPYSAGSEDSDPSVTNNSLPTTHALAVPAKTVGTTWGLGYDRTTQSVFAAAFMKKHAGFGPAGTGAVYKMGTSGTAASVYVDLNAIFGAGTAGANPHDNSDYLHDNFNTTWDAVGKISLGGLDVSEDGKKLYVMNLANRTLYEIPLDAPPTQANIRTAKVPTFSVPNSTGGEGGSDVRPFAVTYYRGQLYVGLVNSAESTQNASDLWAYVYRVDPATLTFSAAPVFQFQLNYPRGLVYTLSDGGGPAAWNPWSPTYANVAQKKGYVIYPQPILSGITFDPVGNMVLGFMDRAGHQTGNLAPEDPSQPKFLQYGMSGGDTLRAFINVPGNLGSGWVLENNGRGPHGEGGGPQNTGQGPGGGEFYWQDNYMNTIHEEVSLGGIVQVPGFPDIATSAYNPARNADIVLTGGIQWYNNSVGNNDKAYLLYNDPNPIFFGKAAGVGDLIAVPDAPPIEIGNRVWRDSNENGIQDAGEPTLPGVVVQLFDASGTTLIATATTDANGNYYFNSGNGTSTPSAQYNVNLKPNTNYQIHINSTQSALAGLQLTKPKADPSSNGNARDSDAFAVGNVGVISVTTGPPGDSDHTFDAGYILIPNQANTASIAGFVFCDVNNDGIRNPGDPPIAGVTIRLTGTSSTGQAVTMTTLTGPDGGYVFSQLPAGTYTVRETQPAGFLDGKDSVGTVNGAPDGTLGNDVLSNIVLPQDAAGVNYNFGELAPGCISGTAFVDNNKNGVPDPGEIGIPGVTITLTGLNDLGDPVSITTTTAGNGLYQFCNLRPGTYTVTETQPEDFIPGPDTIGSLGGIILSSNSIGNIVIGKAGNGVGYNFTELGLVPGKGLFLSSTTVQQIMGNPPPPLWSLWKPLTPGVVAAGSTGGAPLVTLSDTVTGTPILTYDAYAATFGGGVRVATADVNRDGIPDIITGAGPTGGPHVKVFDGATGLELYSFMAFGAGVSTGVYVAGGDLNGDGFADIIVSTGGGTPQVRVFSGRNPAVVLTSFLAYGSSFTGGVNLGVGDINGDYYPDLITGAGAGNPHVKVFDGRALALGTFNAGNPDASLLASFFPYALQFNVGANVAAADVNGDGFADLITGATVGNPHVKVYSGRAIAQGSFESNPEADIMAQWFAYGLNFNVGVNVSAADVNGDGNADVVTGASVGNPHVKVYDGKEIASGSFNPNEDILTSYFAFSQNGGVFVAAGKVNTLGVINQSNTSSGTGGDAAGSVVTNPDQAGSGVTIGSAGAAAAVENRSPQAPGLPAATLDRLFADDALAAGSLLAG